LNEHCKILTPEVMCIVLVPEEFLSGEGEAGGSMRSGCVLEWSEEELAFIGFLLACALFLRTAQGEMKAYVWNKTRLALYIALFF